MKVICKNQTIFELIKNQDMRMLVYTLSFILAGCAGQLKPEKMTTPAQVRESNAENFDNGIREIVATFSSLNASDGEWENGAEEKTYKEVDLKAVENDRLLYCYDTQNLMKIEIYGTVHKASIEYVEGGQKTVIANDKDIDGSFIIFSEKLGQHGKLLIKSQNEVLKEITIEAEDCL